MAVDHGGSVSNWLWTMCQQLTYWVAGDRRCTEGDTVPKLQTVICLCIQKEFNSNIFNGVATVLIYTGWHYNSASKVWLSFNWKCDVTHAMGNQRCNCCSCNCSCNCGTRQKEKAPRSEREVSNEILQWDRWNVMLITQHKSGLNEQIREHNLKWQVYCFFQSFLQWWEGQQWDMF